MSGIVGIVNLDGAPVDGELLHRMTQDLAPRGPDAQQIWIAQHVGFGHTLLRTTWESALEHQPHTLDGQTWIVADCRVDGRDDLIRELAAHGCAVTKDAPDPDLILHAYDVWRAQCLDHLLGDFSFAIWDGRRRALFCARDHFGVKPFLYVRTDRSLIFSNDLSCLRLHPAVSSELDDVAIADFLVYGFPLEAGRSAFSAIRRLPPSHALTLSGSDFSLQRYWQLPLEEELQFRRRGDYIERFLELLDVAVRDRLRTNTVGVLMSGGLDSPAIAATAKRILSASGASFDLRAHTFVFDRNVQGGFNWSSQRRNGEELRWEHRNVVGHIVRDVLRCGRRVVPRLDVVSTGVGSGKRSPAGCPAKRRRWLLAYPSRLERDGSAKVEACRRSTWPHCRGALCRLPSEKKSQSCTPSTLGFVTSLGESAAPPRQSRGSSVAMRQPVVAGLSIARRPRSGTPTGRRKDRRWRSWLQTRSCAGTYKTDSQA